jgi:hypothetical protein
VLHASRSTRPHPAACALLPLSAGMSMGRPRDARCPGSLPRPRRRQRECPTASSCRPSARNLAAGHPAAEAGGSSTAPATCGINGRSPQPIGPCGASIVGHHYQQITFQQAACGRRSPPSSLAPTETVRDSIARSDALKQHLPLPRHLENETSMVGDVLDVPARPGAQDGLASE